MSPCVPKEIIRMIYNRIDNIDNRLLFHKIWNSDLFFTKRKRLQFLSSFSKKFISILSSILQYKATRIELINIINKGIFTDAILHGIVNNIL
jgi:hypothetical protein